MASRSPTKETLGTRSPRYRYDHKSPLGNQKLTITTNNFLNWFNFDNYSTIEKLYLAIWAIVAFILTGCVTIFLYRRNNISPRNKNNKVENLKKNMLNYIHKNAYPNCTGRKPVTIVELEIRFGKKNGFDEALTYFTSVPIKEIGYYNGVFISNKPAKSILCFMKCSYSLLMARSNLWIFNTTIAIIIIFIVIYKLLATNQKIKLHASLIIQNMISQTQDGKSSFTPSEFRPSHDKNWKRIEWEIERNPLVRSFTEQNGNRVWKLINVK